MWGQMRPWYRSARDWLRGSPPCGYHLRVLYRLPGSMIRELLLFIKDSVRAMKIHILSKLSLFGSAGKAHLYQNTQ